MQSLVEKLKGLTMGATFGGRSAPAGDVRITFTGRLDKIGVDPVCGTPAQFAQAIRSDLALWKEAVQAAGVKPQ